MSTRANTRKDVAGYDFTGLLVGSEGTLGIVTRATVDCALRLDRLSPSWRYSQLSAPLVTRVASTMSVTTPSLLEIINGATLRAIDDWCAEWTSTVTPPPCCSSNRIMTILTIRRPNFRR